MLTLILIGKSDTFRLIYRSCASEVSSFFIFANLSFSPSLTYPFPEEPHPFFLSMVSAKMLIHHPGFENTLSYESTNGKHGKSPPIECKKRGLLLAVWGQFHHHFESSFCTRKFSMSFPAHTLCRAVVLNLFSSADPDGNIINSLHGPLYHQTDLKKAIYDTLLRFYDLSTGLLGSIDPRSRTYGWFRN